MKAASIEYYVCIGATFCVAIAVLSGCRRDTSKTTVEEPRKAWFEEVAADSNLDFVHVFAVKQKYYFPEIMSGGVGLLDYDNDGYLDIYFVQGGELDESSSERPGNRMYRNLGDGTFEDVTDATGTGDTSYGMGCACGDYDQDGDVDIYVTNVGANVLYRNNGDGTFTDVTEFAGVGDEAWGTSAAFTDIDGDGFLDLLITNYLNWSPSRELNCKSRLDQKDYCHPLSYGAPAPDTLYRNRGDGTFEDVSVSSGLRTAFGTGLGVAVGDFNGDGRVDLYVANDAMPNQLWMNRGDGTFLEDGLMAGCALNHSGAAESGMGVIAVDVDYDGDLDLFMSHLRDQSNTLYINDDGQFTDSTSSLGLDAPSLAFTGFGLGFADFDHDGRLDLFVANGRVTLTEPLRDPDRPYVEENQLFTGTADGRFAEVFPRGGTRELIYASSRGAAFGDIDNDGDIDIVIVNQGERAHLLRNTVIAGLPVVAERGNWLTLRVLNERGAFAVGASVRIATPRGDQWRQVQRAYSYCASNDPRVHFGLGELGRVEKITVRWPGGPAEPAGRAEEVFGPFDANQIVELRKGAGRR